MSIRWPAEWEPHQGIWVAWPHNVEDWPGRFGPIPWVYADFLNKLSKFEHLHIIAQKNLRPDMLDILERTGIEADTFTLHDYVTDRVWTREVPARQVVVAAAPLVPTQVQAQTRTSTKTRPAEAIAETATQAAANPSYVQVGSFAVPANADGAAARLKALGLPVAKAQITSGGKALQVIYAGPFASAAAAAQALSLARGAGFGDAFIR